MSVELKQWQVFYLFCQYTLPEPKNKYIVLACLEPILFGFMINSCINKYIKERPKLLVCEVLIKKLEHPFLNHDSFIDCREVCPLSENELNDYVGNLNSQTIQHTMESVRNCPVLPRKYKNYIL